MKEQIFSNLFVENAFFEGFKEIGSAEVYHEMEIDGIKICRINVRNEAEAKATNCKLGNHVTLYIPKLWRVANGELERISAHLSEELSRMLKRLVGGTLNGRCFLIAGLGNPNIASDSIGPLTVDKINVTRRIGAHDGCSVCAVRCGVMGETGITSAELIGGIVREIRPHAVVAIDSLAARSHERLGATVQLSDGGIVPGAGIGNRQHAIDREALGVPVVAVGVPTVVSVAALICGTLEKYEMLKKDERLSAVLDKEKRFFVSPGECDMIAKASSYLLSSALNKTFGTE